MKKAILIIACMICAVGLRGCDTNYKGTNFSTYFDYCRIKCEVFGDSTVFYDKNTGVMYYSDSVKGGITPIYNADGTLKLYWESENNEK